MKVQFDNIIIETDRDDKETMREVCRQVRSMIRLDEELAGREVHKQTAMVIQAHEAGIPSSTYLDMSI